MVQEETAIEVRARQHAVTRATPFLFHMHARTLLTFPRIAYCCQYDAPYIMYMCT
jgi:hypothetical protein